MDVLRLRNVAVAGSYIPEANKQSDRLLSLVVLLTGIKQGFTVCPNKCTSMQPFSHQLQDFIYILEVSMPPFLVVSRDQTLPRGRICMVQCLTCICMYLTPHSCR